MGYDNNALYASTDEFNVQGTAYFGSALWTVSKSQLVAMVPSPALVIFGPLILGGIPIITLQPAVSTTATNTEYLLNSFPFADALITPNPISHQLGLWKVNHDTGVSNGNPGSVTLTGTIIRSEDYGFPVNAVIPERASPPKVSPARLSSTPMIRACSRCSTSMGICGPR